MDIVLINSGCHCRSQIIEREREREREKRNSKMRKKKKKEKQERKDKGKKRVEEISQDEREKIREEYDE